MKYAEASDLVRQGVLSRIDMDRNVTDDELYEVIRAELKSGAAEKLSVSDRLSLEHDVFNSLRKLDILQDLIEDDSITEESSRFTIQSLDFPMPLFQGVPRLQ